MVPIARRNLLAEKPRFAVAVGGVAFAVFLIVLIQSLFMGYRQSAGALIEELPFELWVVQDGTFDLYRSSSILPAGYAENATNVDGVSAAQRIVARQVLLQMEGGSEREFLFAFDEPVGERAVTAGLPGSAGTSATGRGFSERPDQGEIVISSELADDSGIEIGDGISIGGERLVVTGTNDDGPSFRGYSYLNYEEARHLFGLGDRTNYVSVALAPGADAEAVAEGIEASLASVEVLASEEFAERSRSEIDVFTPVLAVIMSIGFVVGAAVISLTIYTATIERSREFGVLKALGAGRWYLYRLVGAQSLSVGFLGFAAGVPLAIGVSELVTSIVPEFVTMFRAEAIAGVFVMVLLMSLVSAFLPAHRIARIDPASIFRA